MSRVEFSDDGEHMWLYQQHADAAFNGRRGQAFLREMLSALDSMPVKQLVKNVLVGARGEVCAMGAVAVARGVDVSDVDETNPDAVGRALGIAPRLAMEIAYLNDDEDSDEPPSERFARMQRWAHGKLRPEPAPSPRGTCSWCMRVLTIQRGRVHWHKHNGGACPGAGKSGRP